MRPANYNLQEMGCGVVLGAQEESVHLRPSFPKNPSHILTTRHRFRRGEGMPVKHDLLKDLNVTKEDVAALRSYDDRLSQLLDSYEAVDAEVVEAESGASGYITDDELKKLKEKRLLVKDKIVQRLTLAD